jgi:hypothetical protein
MLNLLLDEQISPKIADALSKQHEELLIMAIRDWHRGRYLSASDEEILLGARTELLTLVTYDRATITPLLKDWGEQGQPHSGVVFVDDRSIRQADIGGLIAALSELWILERDRDWHNRVCFLCRSLPQE